MEHANTTGQIEDLLELGAHFIQLGAGTDGKAPSVGRSWLAYKPDFDAVSGMARAGILIGIVPASVGLIAVDADGPKSSNGKQPLTTPQKHATGVAWTELLGVREAGSAITRSGGLHMFWQLEHPQDVHQPNWEVMSDGKRIVGGETRGNRGYVVVWDIAAIHQAATRNTRKALWSTDYNDTKRLSAQLSRAGRAAAWCAEAPGTHHNTMVEGVAKDVSSGALMDASAWQDAAERIGWDGAGKEVDDAWNGAVDKYGLAPYDDWNPRSTAWRKSRKDADRYEAAVRCALRHGDDESVGEQVLALLDGQMRWFDNRLFSANGALWYPEDRLDLQGLIADIGICRFCANGAWSATWRRLKNAGRNITSKRPAPFLSNGQVVRIDTGEIRVMTKEDLCVWMPTIDIGAAPPYMPNGLSELEQKLFIETWGLDKADCDEFMGFLARGLTASQRQAVLILADPDAGKSTMLEALSRMLSDEAVLAVGGEELDRYYGALASTACFVVVDEAQDMEPKAYKMLKVRTGAGRAAQRAMHQAEGSRQSRSTLLMAAERKRFKFGAHMRGGWMSRLKVFVQRTNNIITREERDYLLRPESIKQLAWRVLQAASLRRGFEYTYNLDESNRAIRAVIGNDSPILKFHADGSLQLPD